MLGLDFLIVSLLLRQHGKILVYDFITATFKLFSFFSLSELAGGSEEISLYVKAIQFIFF